VHSSTLLLELGGVIFALGLLGTLASRVGISPIPLYLVGGLAVGEGGLLPLATGSEFISVGSEIGVVLLLLTLGLEYSADELVANLRRHGASGGVNLLLNFTPGLVTALILDWGPVAAVAMGGITYASSSGIAAKLLGDLHWLGNRETPVVLSLLVLEDLSIAVYLPILTALLASGTLLAGSASVAAALGLLAVVLFVALRHGERVSRLVFTSSDEVLLLRVLGIALLVAGIAERLQVSAAVGAFLVGIALSGEVAEGARDLLMPLKDLFAAVFFVFFGLRTDPSAIPPVLVIAALLASVTIVTKVATGWWAARRAGIGTVGRFRAGSLLIARGEFSIVIAGLAAAAGIEPRLGALAAAYVLLMATLGPLAVRVVEPVSRSAVRRRAARRGRPASADPIG
jgi:CPA2 family monovalent cation:H+ antiporter-2